MLAAVDRLDAIAPGFAAALAGVSDERAHAIESEVCRIATATSGLKGVEVDNALHAASAGQLDSAAAASMRALAEDRDEVAWKARDAGDDATYLTMFGQARAAAALAFALEGARADAIYEAAHAVDRPDELLMLLARDHP
jgi:hypothetical protein